MKRCGKLALAVGFLGTLPVSGQDSAVCRFQWHKGHVLTYRVTHNTTVAEVIGANKVESSSRLNLTKRWQITEVDDQGIGTLLFSLTGLRHEQTRPNGEKLLFDSANLDKSTPELKEAMNQFLGKTLAKLRIDRQGKVVEVLQGSASRYEAELPFILALPSQPVQPGMTWLRSFQVVLDPPLGTGEKYAANQEYQCRSVAGGKAVINLITRFKTMPESLADRVPLLPKQPEGQVVMDVQTGRLLHARLVIDKTLANHQGEGTSYHFQSLYTEELTTGTD